jgi:hypothetical protein
VWGERERVMVIHTNVWIYVSLTIYSSSNYSYVLMTDEVMYLSSSSWASCNICSLLLIHNNAKELRILHHYLS